MNWFLIVLYVLFAVLGSTLLKGGSKMAALFTLPLINLPISVVTLIGFVFYGLSFLVYTALLSTHELSIISPITVGAVYVLLMITAFVFFSEPISAQKIIGSVLILVGVLVMTMKIG